MNVNYYEPMDLDFIEEFWDELDMNKVIQYQKLPQSFIENHFSRLDTNALLRYQKMTIDFIKEKWEWFDKNILMKYVVLPIEYLSEKWDEIKNYTLDTVAKYQKMTTDFILEKWNDIQGYSDKIMAQISRYQKLTVDFIKDKWDYIDKNYISKYQKLTVDFIKESLHSLNRAAISAFQVIEDSVRTVLGLEAPAKTITGTEILSFSPCEDGMARYNKHTPNNNTVLTWNELLEKHLDGTSESASDIHWLTWKLGKKINT